MRLYSSKVELAHKIRKNKNNMGLWYGLMGLAVNLICWQYYGYIYKYYCAVIVHFFSLSFLSLVVVYMLTAKSVQSVEHFDYIHRGPFGCLIADINDIFFYGNPTHFHHRYVWLDYVSYEQLWCVSCILIVSWFIFYWCLKDARKKALESKEWRLTLRNRVCKLSVATLICLLICLWFFVFTTFAFGSFAMKKFRDRLWRWLRGGRW